MPSQAAKVAASLARPPVDLRHLLPPVRSQGTRPLCVPFAITTANEAARSLLGVGTPADILAVEPVWQHCVNSGSGGHQGTSIGAAAEGLANRGQPLEAHWPYNHTLGVMTEPDPPAAATVDWHGADMVNVPLYHDGVEDLIETALALGLPVVLLVEQTDQFDFPDPDGEIGVPPINSPVGDYHAVVVAGAATSADGSTRRLLVRNSWGTGWGAGGYGWMPLDYLTAFVVQAAALNPNTMYTH